MEKMTRRKVVAFNLDEKVPVMPLHKILDKHTTFKIHRVNQNGNYSVEPLEGDLKGMLCLLSSTCRIALGFPDNFDREAEDRAEAAREFKRTGILPK